MNVHGQWMAWIAFMSTPYVMNHPHEEINLSGELTNTFLNNSGNWNFKSKDMEVHECGEPRENSAHNT